MEERRTFGEFIGSNKKKIIVGAVIATAVVVGVIVGKKLLNGGANNFIELTEEVVTQSEPIMETLETIEEVTTL